MVAKLIESLLGKDRASIHVETTPFRRTLLSQGNRTVIHLVNHETYGICVEKRLRPFCDVAQERKGLIREARLQRESAMEGVVSILGIEDDSFYRSYVQGLTLKEALESTQMSQGFSYGEALCLLRPFANILLHLHEGTSPSSTKTVTQPLVHRDFTLGNLYLSSDGQVLLSDFGLSYRPAFDTLGADEVLQGTPKFLAPELLSGKLPSPASDVYQMALVAACLLSPPILEQEGPAPVSLRPAHHLHLGQLWHELARQQLQAFGLEVALELDPKKRPTAREFLELLDKG